jgi:hypothetical protein
MCRSHITQLARVGYSVAVLVILTVLATPSYAQITIQGFAGPTFPASVNVGATNQPGSLTITNTSTGGASVQVQTISLNPSCKSTLASPCPAGQGDPGVFALSATGTGRAGTACAGTVFTISAPDAEGNVQFTPAGFTLGPGASCIIDFTFSVLKLPTVDCNPAIAGVQACQVGNAFFMGINANGVNASGLSGAGSGSTSTTINFTCTVQIDKQISCDGGATFADVGFGDSVAAGCIGAVGLASIKVQYVARNTGQVALSGCTIGESNVNLGPGVTATFPIAVGATTGNLGLSSNSLVCETARGTSGEPDTATINCGCVLPQGATPQTATATDQANFACCGAQVDKQVSCNGGPFADVGFNDNATNGCSATVGQPVAIRYLTRNTGSTAIACSLGDVQSIGGANLFSVPAGGINIASGGADVTTTNTTTNTCTAALSAGEPNTATINCVCSATNLGTRNAVNSDTARITCVPPPGIPSVSKTCVQIPGTSNFLTTVKIDNTEANAANLSCNITDTFFTNGTTPVSCANIVGATSNTLTPPTATGVAVAANTMPTFTGTINALTASACNTVSVSCTAGGVSVGTIPGATADCPVQTGCFTRTPGYWATHPTQTQQVIDGGLQVCGITLTNVNAPSTSGSAIEDLCSQNGQEAKANNTSTQQLQLQRQCTSAALNLRVSANPAAHLNCEASQPGITATFQACCVGPTSVCDSGRSGQQIAASNCIEDLDAFNNHFDNTDFPSFLVNSSADPNACQIADSDKLINSGRNLGK